MIYSKPEFPPPPAILSKKVRSLPASAAFCGGVEGEEEVEGEDETNGIWLE